MAMSSPFIAATVRCGRQFRQSRKRVVEATLVTCEQRRAETPGQAWTTPTRTCQPEARANCAGLKRTDPAEAVWKQVLVRAAEAASRTRRRARILMANSTRKMPREVPLVNATAEWASVPECHPSCDPSSARPSGRLKETDPA